MRSGFGILCIMLLSTVMVAQAGADALDDTALNAATAFKGDKIAMESNTAAVINTVTLKARCDEDTIDIVLFTDGYASETSWELRHTDGTLVESNGVLANDTLYETEVCVPYDGCYNFTIFDSYGDGICCSYGEGYYQVYLNGVLQCEGGEFGASETCAFIGTGCGDPTGACCVSGECVATNTEAECGALSGDWFYGENCQTYVCPVDACPEGSVVNNPYQDPESSWSFGVSDVRYTPENSTLLRFDSFADAGLITAMRFWGLSLSNPWANCTEDPFTVEIKFYGAGAEPGAEVGSYTVDIVGTPTGLLYAGYEMVQYDVTLMPAINIVEGWVSVLGISEGSPDCWFLWANSDYGDSGDHLMSEDGAPYTTEGNDLAFCLVGNYVPEFGACCDDDTGVCEDNVELINCFGRFAADTLCVDLDPACEATQGACCDDATGICVDDVNILDCTTRFVEGVLCADLDPQCGQIPGACCYDDGTCAVVVQAECVPFFVVCGDFEPDGDVDIDDYMAFVAAFGSCYGDANWNEVADLDGDCCVTLVDYQLFIQCFRTGGYEVGATFLGEYTTCDECPCMVVCPPCPVTPEGEPDCGGAYVDNYNGGCNSDPNVFGEIAIDETICGTSGTNDVGRDTDWFEITTTEPMILTFAATGEFPMLIFIIDGGNGDCSSTPILVSATADPCMEAVAVSECLAPGLYYLWVGPSVFADWPCSLNYYCTLTAEACSIPTGACCVAGDCVETNYEDQCLTLGGTWFIGETCPEFQGCPQPPANDLCENATALTGVVTDVPFDTTMAYFDGTGTCMTSANVWFCYTAEADGEYTIELCGSAFDTKLAVYDRCVCDPMGAEMGCNDDSAICDADSLQSALVLNLFEGHQYLIEVGGYSSNVGPGDISIYPNVVPTGACCVDMACVETNFEYECDGLGGAWFEGMTCPEFDCPNTGNDYCADAIALTGTVTDYPFDTTAMSFDGTGTCMTSANAWFCYTAEVDGEYTFDLCGSSYDTKIAVYDGCACDPMGAELGCNDDSPLCDADSLQSALVLNLVGGQEYLVEVGGYSSNAGPGDLSIFQNITPPGACCVEGICEITNFEYECDALGGDWFVGETCPEFEGCPEPCIVECTGTEEGEPICEEAYVDMYNGGCNSDPFIFQAIACEETMCGTSGTFINGTGGNSRDTDWFEVTLEAAGTLTWTVTAEFPVLIFIIDAGTSDCADYTILDSATAEECVPVSLSFAVDAGTYWVWVGPSVFDGVPCGVDYEGILTCTADGAAPSKPAVGSQQNLGNTAPVSPKKF